MSDWTISETEAGGLLLPTTTPSGPHVVVLGRRQRAYLANVVLALPEVKAAIQQAVRQRESALTSRCEAAIEAVIASSQAEIAKQLSVSENTVSAQLTIGVKKCMAFMLRCRREREGRWP